VTASAEPRVARAVEGLSPSAALTTRARMAAPRTTATARAPGAVRAMARTLLNKETLTEDPDETPRTVLV